MKRALLLFCALALLPGCSYILPQSNQSPRAYINAITPSEVAEGEVVKLSGYGTDTDGQVVAYRWKSDRDGQIGTLQNIETSSLSVGRHVISFSVQDNNDAWSNDAGGTVDVLPRVVAPAEINSFTASATTISEGDSVTLSWNVANASLVSIDQGIGTVSASGSVTVSPVATITYKLTATGEASTATSIITITVQEPGAVVTLTADSEASGFVRSSGANTTGFVYVGDDSNNRGFQGFVTFDTSCIPDNAIITRVIVDMTSFEIPYDVPYPHLGCLSAFVHDYNRLEASDYWTKALPVPIAEWCDVAALETPTGFVGFRNALQQRVGDNRFQFRLQFPDRETDEDNENDLLRWPLESLPRITVEYHLYQ